MARTCDICGKGPRAGNSVVRHGLPKKKGGISLHTTGVTKRRFLPNLQVRRFWVPSQKRWVKLKLSTRGIRIIDKLGIERVIADMRRRGIKV